MYAILSGIQGLVNLLFFVAIVGTLGVSWVFADRLRKRHNADFPWNKTAIIVGIEIALWIGFTLFWNFFKNNWWEIIIVAVIIIIIVLVRKKKRYG